MKLIELEEQKKIELTILKLFAEYCEEHGLRYYLYAGTLLGAVRHAGFIPWDDDIDVVMPRPDYEKLFKLLTNEPLTDSIDCISYRNCDTCIAPFIKLIDNRTDGHEKHLPEHFNTGVWIDIFPMDGLPTDKSERDNHINKMQRLIQTLYRSTNPYVPDKNFFINLRRFTRYHIFCHFSFQKICKRLEELGMSYPYENSDCIGITVFCSGQNNVIEKEGFEGVVKLPFEGLEFNAPSTYKQYLSNLYGDYMKLPPKEKQVPMHGYVCWWKDEISNKGNESDE